ncbi:MAG: DNA mismatch repair endonuclease MutL [Planctomycetota bacterium]|nr:DNA mismatch repair endonuclease MutL [Planctomycetota bacterium]MDG2144384.1 DNA mismatch repair endonuclease MutL [Planctomycetota bacterium]
MTPIPKNEAVISKLPQTVVNQIAAGEVIERPASVVKELVENAIDAGATRIRVDLEEGGVRLVRVVDDGCGMGAADLELVFAAHATSKLFTPDDLDHIASLGFRGEAMASIGSIARCRVISRTPDNDGDAFGIENQGGDIGEVTASGAALGTTIEVRDLFYNTPARRRFLKRTSTELSRCLDVIQRLALAHEGIGFVATHDGRRLYDVDPEMDLLGRVRRTFGAELAESLVPVTYVENEDGTGMRLEGFVAPPRFSRRDTSRLMWFLNGRFLRDKLLHRVLKEGYRGFLEHTRQPVAFLRLSMNPALVDVNVHPTKSEVRFREGRRLFGTLVKVLREAVASTDIATPGAQLVDRVLTREQRENPDQAWLPVSGASPPKPAGVVYPWDRGNQDQAGSIAEQPTTSSFAEAFQHAAAAPGAGQTPREQSQDWAATDDLRGPYLQVDKTYLVRAIADGFEVIDQHALHERLTYELLLLDMREGKMQTQGLLVPEMLEFSRSEVKLIGQHVDSIKSLGVDLAVFGPTTIAVHGIPGRMRRPGVKAIGGIEGIVEDLVNAIEETGKPPSAEDVVEEVLHRMACRSSVMAGDSLTQDEIHSLLVRARELGCDQTCPHSRPTRVRFTVDDLERAFHRK